MLGRGRRDDRREERHEDRREFGVGGSATQYKMRQQLFAFGDDFWIEDSRGRRAYKVDGKVMRVRETLVMRDAQGNEVAAGVNWYVAGHPYKLQADWQATFGDDFGRARHLARLQVQLTL